MPKEKAGATNGAPAVIALDPKDARRIGELLRDSADYWGRLGRGEPTETFDGDRQNATDWAEFCARLAPAFPT